MNPDLNIIATALDDVHAIARNAYCARDINAYQATFTDDLCYIQPNGKPIGLSQLMRDVQKQLSQFKSLNSEYTRESIAMNEDGTVTEVVRQHARCSLSVFLFFTKTWTIERHGKYTYRKTDQGWRICDVEVLSESVS